MSQYDDLPTQIHTIQVKAMSDSPWQIIERSYLTRKTALARAKSYRASFRHLFAVRLVTSVIDDTLTQVL